MTSFSPNPPLPHLLLHTVVSTTWLDPVGLAPVSKWPILSRYMVFYRTREEKKKGEIQKIECPLERTPKEMREGRHQAAAGTENWKQKNPSRSNQNANSYATLHRISKTIQIQFLQSPQDKDDRQTRPFPFAFHHLKPSLGTLSFVCHLLKCLVPRPPLMPKANRSKAFPIILCSTGLGYS